MRRFLSLIGIVLLTAQAAAAPISQEMGIAFGLYSEAVKAKNHKLALTHAGTVETLAAKELSADDPSRLAASLNYATALLNVRKKEQAIVAFENSLLLHEAAYGDSDPRLLQLLVSLVAATGNHTSPSPQNKYAQRARKIAKAAYGKDSIEYARYSYDIGKYVFPYHPSARSIRYIRDANTIFAKQLGLTDTETARTEFLLGKFALMQKRHKTAEKHLTTALQGFERDESQAAFDSNRITRGFLVDVYERMKPKALRIDLLSPAAVASRSAGQRKPHSVC